MPTVPARHSANAAAGRRSAALVGRRSDAGFVAAFVVLVALVFGLTFGSGTPDASAQTTPGPINTIVVRMTGQMAITFDKNFVKTIKRSGASVQVKSGAKYSNKKRLATLPVDSTVAVTFDPADADILAKGTISFRRKDKRNVTVQDVSLRIRAAGADLGGTVRGRPSRQFAALTLSPTTNITQTQNGAAFVDLQMLVSPDLARAARQAKIKGVKEGALLGVVTAYVGADLPVFQLPELTIPGLDPNVLPAPGTTIDIPGIGPVQIPGAAS